MSPLAARSAKYSSVRKAETLLGDRDIDSEGGWDIVNDRIRDSSLPRRRFATGVKVKRFPAAFVGGRLGDGLESICDLVQFPAVQVV